MGGNILDITASWQPSQLFSWHSTCHDIKPNWSNVVCFDSVDDILSYYDGYVPLWDPTSIHVLNGVRSQLNICNWRDMLCGGPNRVYGDQWDIDALYILDGVINGFKLVDPNAAITPYHCTNYRSATVEAYAPMRDLLLSEVQQGKLCVVSEKPVCIHALGAISKPDGSYRPITDASRPTGMSINNYMEMTFNTFKFSTVDMVSAHLQEGWYSAVTDLAAAYRSVLIRASDRVFQGLAWNFDGLPVYLVDAFLAFGSRMAPHCFNRLTDAIVRYMRACGFLCWNYLDDIIVLGPTYESCREAQLFLHKLLHRLGFYVSFKKVRSPNTRQLYLGIVMDSLSMTLSLPQEKLDRLYRELDFFENRTRISKKQLQKLCGVLSHCATVVRGGRTFSRRMIDMLSAFDNCASRYIRITEGFKQDLQWWASYATIFNGQAKILPHKGLSSTYLFCDASDTGYGAWHGADWIFGTWAFPAYVDIDDSHGHHVGYSPDLANYPISVREMYPILVSLLRWGPVWLHNRVTIYSDNVAVVHGINKGTSENEMSMQLLRHIFWLSVCFDCHLVAVHVPGKYNITADRLSRLCETNIVPLPLCCSPTC